MNFLNCQIISFELAGFSWKMWGCSLLGQIELELEALDDDLLRKKLLDLGASDRTIESAREWLEIERDAKESVWKRAFEDKEEEIATWERERRYKVGEKG